MVEKELFNPPMRRRCESAAGKVIRDGMRQAQTTRALARRNHGDAPNALNPRLVGGGQADNRPAPRPARICSDRARRGNPPTSPMASTIVIGPGTEGDRWRGHTSPPPEPSTPHQSTSSSPQQIENRLWLSGGHHPAGRGTGPGHRQQRPPPGTPGRLLHMGRMTAGGPKVSPVNLGSSAKATPAPPIALEEQISRPAPCTLKTPRKGLGTTPAAIDCWFNSGADKIRISGHALHSTTAQRKRALLKGHDPGNRRRTIHTFHTRPWGRRRPRPQTSSGSAQRPTCCPCSTTPRAPTPPTTLEEQPRHVLMCATPGSFNPRRRWPSAESRIPP